MLQKKTQWHRYENEHGVHVQLWVTLSVQYCLHEGTRPLNLSLLVHEWVPCFCRVQSAVELEGKS